MRKGKRKLLAFVLAGLMMLGALQGVPAQAKKSLWPKNPETQTEAYVVMDLATGEVLLSKNPEKSEYPASITKVMTALLACENCRMNEKVTFTDEAVGIVDPESCRIGMIAGEVLKLKHCMYGMLLPSANEVANAIGIHVGGSIEGFADMMNARAEELGAVNTHFTNPNGLFDENHWTCAIDMAKIAREAATHEFFLEVAGTPHYIVPATKLVGQKRSVWNTNLMFNGGAASVYYYAPCYAGKTGYLNEARYTLVTYAKQDDLDIVCVVMRAPHRKEQYEESQLLCDTVFEKFQVVSASAVSLSVDPAEELFTDMSYSLDGEVTPEQLAESVRVDDVKMVIPAKAAPEDVDAEIVWADLTEMKEGDNVIGQVTYRIEDREVITRDLLYTSDRAFAISSPPVETPVPEEPEVKEEPAAEETPEAAETSESKKADEGTPAITEVIREKASKLPAGTPYLILIGAVVLAVLIFFVGFWFPQQKNRGRKRRRKK